MFVFDYIMYHGMTKPIHNLLAIAIIMGYENINVYFTIKALQM